MKQKRKCLIMILLCGILLWPVLPVFAQPQAGEQTYSFPQATESVKTVGRTSTDDIGLAVHTTGGGIAFYSECAGDVTLDLLTRNDFAETQYFTVVVDGERRRECIDNRSRKAKENTLTLASDLPQGMHAFEIYRQTEEVNAACWFTALHLSGNPIPMANAPMLIEFVGDSITAGYGILPLSAGKGADDPEGQDGTATYAYQTAQALGLDFQACCTSGYGAYRGWNQGNTNLKDMYPYTAYHHNADTGKEMWAFSRPADIVVINLGTNDATVGRSKGVTDTTFRKGAKELIELVKEKNPNAKIVWATGMMGTFFLKPLTSLTEELGGAQAGYYVCELPKGTSGTAGHPNAEEHTAAAKVLTEFLREQVLPADYEQQFVTPEQMQALLDSTSCDEEVYRVAQTALQVYRADGGVSRAALTAAYRSLSAWKEENTISPTVWWLIFGGIIIVGIIAVTAAILYNPKPKKTKNPKSNADSEPKNEGDKKPNPNKSQKPEHTGESGASSAESLTERKE